MVVELPNTGDTRGSSFSVPVELVGSSFPVADIHLATIAPGAVRGNHYHVLRHEILLVLASDRWSLHWDEGPGETPQSRRFEGSGAVLVYVPTGMSHAIRNDGSAALTMVGLTDGPYDPDQPDVYPRAVVSLVP
ncbi:hypothetical protein AB0M54_05305 [Actinoplanes sp. NPDC051470]|uniref:polysaccharide biosynthesis C-terminal domain-containing protein n=1 Tax=Actinoplanes sp. NPDC051470 TaxID=3157224 RepID=UPI003434CFA1